MPASKKKLPYVVVRCYSAGVHVGELVGHDAAAKTVVVRNDRLIHYWKGALSTNDIAVGGVAAGSKISAPVPSDCTHSDVISVIPCTEQAEKILREFSPWRP